MSRILKSISAVYLFENFKDLKQRKFWGTGLWSRATYYSTIEINDEILKKYINDQINEIGDKHTRT